MRPIFSNRSRTIQRIFPTNAPIFKRIMQLAKLLHRVEFRYIWRIVRSVESIFIRIVREYFYNFFQRLTNFHAHTLSQKQVVFILFDFSKKLHSNEWLLLKLFRSQIVRVIISSDIVHADVNSNEIILVQAYLCNLYENLLTLRRMISITYISSQIIHSILESFSFDVIIFSKELSQRTIFHQTAA